MLFPMGPQHPSPPHPLHSTLMPFASASPQETLLLWQLTSPHSAPPDLPSNAPKLTSVLREGITHSETSACLWPAHISRTGSFCWGCPHTQLADPWLLPCVWSLLLGMVSLPMGHVTDSEGIWGLLKNREQD